MHTDLPPESQGYDLAKRADELCQERGLFDPSMEQYIQALDQAEAELRDSDSHASEHRPYTGSREGAELVIRAKHHLANMGLYEGDYDSTQFMAGLLAAAVELGIDLDARSAWRS